MRRRAREKTRPSTTVGWPEFRFRADIRRRTSAPASPRRSRGSRVRLVARIVQVAPPAVPQRAASATDSGDSQAFLSEASGRPFGLGVAVSSPKAGPAAPRRIVPPGRLGQRGLAPSSDSACLSAGNPSAWARYRAGGAAYSHIGVRHQSPANAHQPAVSHREITVNMERGNQSAL